MLRRFGMKQCQLQLLCVKLCQTWMVQSKRGVDYAQMIYAAPVWAEKVYKVNIFCESWKQFSVCPRWEWHRRTVQFRRKRLLSGREYYHYYRRSSKVSIAAKKKELLTKEISSMSANLRLLSGRSYWRNGSSDGKRTREEVGPTSSP